MRLMSMTRKQVSNKLERTTIAPPPLSFLLLLSTAVDPFGLFSSAMVKVLRYDIAVLLGICVERTFEDNFDKFLK